MEERALRREVSVRSEQRDGPPEEAPYGSPRCTGKCCSVQYVSRQTGWEVVRQAGQMFAVWVLLMFSCVGDKLIFR